jgi:putative oxygen-independent coproporphyrinogen III oxidase
VPLPADFGIYVHWPFCQSKCPYCDFNSHVSAKIDQSQWLAAYRAELARHAGETQGRTVRTVFFGGGTPSLMDPETVDGVLAAIRSHWTIANDWEVTLEANPTSVEAGRFRAYRQAGVNRISMGLQSLNDAHLRALGRLHTVAEAKAAFSIARNTFDRVSFDLIYARQDQTLADWRAELTEALALAADHLSLYQLTIEDGTAFGDRFARGLLKGLPSEDTQADMFDLTTELTTKAGLPAYEVSNHARPGAECQHNLIYWRSGDWLGVGPGAHGRLTLPEGRFATVAHRAPGAWLKAVNDGSGELPRERLTPTERADEYLLMGLRLSDGIDFDHHAALGGQPIPNYKLSEMEDLGMVVRDGTRLFVTAKGRPLLNAVLAKLAS